MPRKVPLRTVVGSPVDVGAILGLKDGERVAEPTPEQVDKVYTKVKTAVTRLYYAHR
jgi:hypothetical protein